MSDDLVKLARLAQFDTGVDLYGDLSDRIVELEVELATCEKYKAAYAECDRIGTQAVRELEANNKRLNEQMDAIEEMGTESLNALPDCLMRLAPALVENDELKAKLEKALEFIQDLTGCEWPYCEDAKRILAELKGKTDE